MTVLTFKLLAHMWLGDNGFGKEAEMIESTQVLLAISVLSVFPLETSMSPLCDWDSLHQLSTLSDWQLFAVLKALLTALAGQN